MTYFSYQEFKQLSERKDKGINDTLHFFSSIFRSPCAYVLYRLRFSPNFATLLFGFVGVCSAISFHYGYAILAYALFRLHIIIDMADGSIARATSTYSQYADGYDKCCHLVVNSLIILVLTSSLPNFLSWATLVIFLLGYLFKNLFSSYPKGVNPKFSTLPKVIAKNLLGFEGFIFISTFVLTFSFDFMLQVTAFYLVTFFAIFVAKMNSMRVEQ